MPTPPATPSSPAQPPAEAWPPKSMVCLREGEGRQFLSNDLLAGVHAQPLFAMTQYGLIDKIGEQNMFEGIDDALGEARRALGLPSCSAAR